jgi:hypothetical protein
MTNAPDVKKGETSILQFEFDKKISILGTITDTENIKFIWDKEKETNAVTGFQITIKQSNEKKIIHVKEQTAPRLTNILSSITGNAITYKPPEIKKIRNGQTFTVVSKTMTIEMLRSIGIDNIDIPKLSSLLYRHSKLSMQLAHGHNGQKAFFSEDYPQAIREYFLIFEYSGCPEEIKYRNLRHAVSHVRLNNKDAIKDLKINFHLPIQAGKELDVNDSRIKNILHKHAREFQHSVGLYLNEQLRNELAKK